MLESLRDRLFTKDKKPNAFIEPNEGWESVVAEIKRAALERKENFENRKPNCDYHIGELGYDIFAYERFNFSAKIPQDIIMQELAKWTFFALSSDHSESVPQFEFQDVTGDFNVLDPFAYWVTKNRTNVNESWDLNVNRIWVEKEIKVQRFYLELIPKFTEADRK